MVAVGLWMSAATALSGYATVNWVNDQMSNPDARQHSLGGLDYETVRAVNVPMIANGALQGYVVAKLVFTADTDALARLSVPPHPFLVDEAFRRLYSDTSLDFTQLERYDLDSLTEELRMAANNRIGDDVIQDVLVEEFNYFAKDDVLSH